MLTLRIIRNTLSVISHLYNIKLSTSTYSGSYNNPKNILINIQFIYER